MRRILYASTIIFIGILFFTNCKTVNRPNLDSSAIWEDATLVAEQRAEIEQLRRNLDDMGNLIQDVSDGIIRITDELSIGLERSRSIEDVFGEIDSFVRKLIDENRKLREVQSTDWGEDAGER